MKAREIAASLILLLPDLVVREPAVGGFLFENALEVRVSKLRRHREDDDVARPRHAVVIEVGKRREELRAGFSRMGRKEMPGLSIHRRGREAKDFAEGRKLLARDHLPVVVLRGVALFGKTQKDILFHFY